MYNRKYEYEDTRSGGLEAVVGDYRIRIEPDDDTFGDTPRDWCNLGTMICFHKNYKLGDKHNYRSDDYGSWDELAKAIKEDFGKDCVLKIIRMYDHSGISLSLGNGYPYNDVWDSGYVGFIVVSKEKIRKEYNVKHVTKAIMAKVDKSLQSEIDVYNQYLDGDIWGFVIEKLKTCDCCHQADNEHIDSCWGYYGIDYAIENAEDALEYELKGETANV